MLKSTRQLTSDQNYFQRCAAIELTAEVEANDYSTAFLTTEIRMPTFFLFRRTNRISHQINYGEAQ